MYRFTVTLLTGLLTGYLATSGVRGTLWAGQGTAATFLLLFTAVYYAGATATFFHPLCLPTPPCCEVRETIAYKGRPAFKRMLEANTEAETRW